MNKNKQVGCAYCIRERLCDAKGTQSKAKYGCSKFKHYSDGNK